MTDVRITGAEQLTALSRRFKATNDKAMRRELFRGLNRATKPARQAARQRAGQILPRRGGLARRVAAARMSTQTRTRGNESHLSIVAKSADHLRGIDAGEVRHPVFNTGQWVSQPVRPGWFTQPMQENRKTTQRELAAVLDRIARQVK